MNTDLNEFRAGVRKWKQRLLRQASSSADQLVQSKPGLAKARQSFADLNRGISETPTDDGIRFTLAESMEPVNAWWNILSSFSLYQAHQKERIATLRAKLNLSNILLGAHNYHSVHKRWPDDIRDEQGNALLSWRVNLLPYVEELGLYRQFKLDEPWDSPNNKKLLSKMPSVYGVRGKTPDGNTFLQRPRVEGAKPIKSLNDITDGSANTIAIVPVKVAVPWTKPGDHKVSENDPWKGVMESGWFGFADGVSSRINQTKVGKKLFGAFTPAGGEKPIDVEASNKRGGVFSSAASSGSPSEQQIANTTERCMSLLKSDDPFQVAIGLIGLEGRQYDWKKLRPMLESRFDFVRHKAIVLMAKTEQPGVVAAIFRPDGSDQAAVWQCLHDTQIGKKYAAKELLPLLRHTDRDYRLEAGFAVAVFGGKEYRSHIEALLKDADEVVRKDALQMLKIIDDASE